MRGEKTQVDAQISASFVQYSTRINERERERECRMVLKRGRFLDKLPYLGMFVTRGKKEEGLEEGKKASHVMEEGSLVC